MEKFDLLSVVQPDTGWYCVVGIQDGRTKQYLYDNRQEFDARAARLNASEHDVYFGVAKYVDGSSRTKANVHMLRALWVDLDCGPTKEYEDQATALLDLKRFVRVAKLPTPIVVNSGRGVHAYWPLDRDVTPAEWTVLATGLRAVCDTHALKADRSCFETARILRLPGSLNYKDDPPSPVTVLHEGSGAADVDELYNTLSVVPPSPERRVFSPLAQSTMRSAHNPNLFSRIMARTPPCAQLEYCVANRATLSEPVWFAALSIAKHCEDTDEAIEAVSQDHPGYSPEAAMAKIAHIVGPRTCLQFEDVNPGFCGGCPHAKTVKSPVSLGEYIPAAAPEDYDEDEDTPPDEPRRPDYPEPYFRQNGGGIAMRVRDDTGEGDAHQKIFHLDFYLVKRMEEPDGTQVVLARLYTRNDGVREFTIPCSVFDGSTTLRTTLAARGIVLRNAEAAPFLNYVISAFYHLADNKKVEIMHNQFGWKDNDTKFVMGDRELTARGTYHTPPSSVTASVAQYMTPCGSLAKWKEVFDLYGKPGLEPHAFAAATAFGAPLLKFSGQSGAIINLIHPTSGTGKTTILHMCNSVWGHPARLCAIAGDTFNSKVHKLGVLCNVPICFDEMSNTPATQLSDLAYMISQGVGKDRMKASSNELRLNLTKWQTIALCSSNHSFYERLEMLKNRPEGEMMRIMEYHLGPTHVLDMLEAKELFDHQLMENYGHASEIYIRYVLENYEEVKALYAAMQHRLDVHLALSPRERFWSATAAANLTGAYIAVKLGLCDWDMARLFKWVCKMIKGLRGTTAAPLDDELQLLGEFILTHIDSIAVVNDAVDRRTGMQLAVAHEPKYQVLGRYEPDTKLMYITSREFRSYCQTRQANYKDTINKLERRGLYKGCVNKRLGKGLRLHTLPVMCMILDGSHSEFIDVEQMVPSAE